MCYCCWEEYDKAQIDNPNVRTAAASIEELYRHAPTGGRMHIATDDWNLEDENLAFCRSMIDNYQPYEFDTPETIEAEKKCLEALEKLTFEERVSAIALESGFWGK